MTKALKPGNSGILFQALNLLDLSSAVYGEFDSKHLVYHGPVVKPPAQVPGVEKDLGRWFPERKAGDPGMDGTGCEGTDAPIAHQGFDSWLISY